MYFGALFCLWVCLAIVSGRMNSSCALPTLESSRVRVLHASGVDLSLLVGNVLEGQAVVADSC